MRPVAQGAPNVTSELPRYRSLRQQKPVTDILRSIREAAALPLERSTTLPPETYTSDAFFDWETQNLLRKEWLCLAHISQLPKAGDFIKVELLNEPLLV